MTTLDEHVEVLWAARTDQRRGRNVFVDEPRWSLPRPDPTIPHPYAPRRYSNGFETITSDSCWCDGLEDRPIHVRALVPA